MRLTNTLLEVAAIVTFVGSLILSTDHVQAEDKYGSFDPYTGQYSYYAERGFTPPRHEESFYMMREREYNSRLQSQADQWRSEVLRQERERQLTAQPSRSSSGPEYIYGPDGKMTTCWPSFNNTKYCQ